MSGLFGKYFHSQNFDLSNQEYFSKYSSDRPPIIIKEVIDPRFERFLRKQFDWTTTQDEIEKQDNPKSSSVLIEEEQQVVSNSSENDDQDDLPLVP
mmetsp:Transcript_3325/g.6081  ORF Transcript_3325/g.6081 Transcript_3325/m.6081 type:complete len:96 (+) Transcript_3325:1-288(+)